MTQTTEQTIERRSENGVLIALVNQVIVNQATMDAKLSSHMVEESQEIADKIAEAIAKLAKEAFTDSNLAAHKTDHETRFTGIENQLKLGDERMGRIEASVAENTAMTSETYEIVSMGKGFFKGLAWFGKWIRKILMWVLPLATAILTFWYAITGHGPTK